jgi:twitching motility protein PilI
VSSDSKQPPILILYQLDQRSRAYAHGLPQQLEAKSTWDGIAFRLGGFTVLAPMEQVGEILTISSISRIPGAKEWVRGIANVRGNLLPILDLPGFVFGKVSKMTRKSRVLLMQYQGISAGLMVDEALGMRHFLEEEFSERVEQLDKSIMPFLSGSLHQRGEVWGVFNIHQLVERPEFMQVAA